MSTKRAVAERVDRGLDPRPAAGRWLRSEAQSVVGIEVAVQYERVAGELEDGRSIAAVPDRALG